MNRNDVILGDELAALKDKTIEKVFQAVTGTMGPDGNFGVLDYGTKPKVTKDGVSVAKAIKFPDPTMDLIAQVITEAAIKTDQICGDGTTTTTFLTYHFYQMFKDLLNVKGSFGVKAKLQKLLARTLEIVEESTVKAGVDSDVIYDMALTTANREEVIAKTVLDIFKSAGVNAVIDLHMGNGSTDQVEYFKGVRFDGGYASPVFSPGGAGVAFTFKNAKGVVFDGSFRQASVEDINLIGNALAEAGSDPTIIVARDFSPEWITVFNSLNHKYKTNIIPVNIKATGTSGAGLIGDLSLCVNGSANNVYITPEAWGTSGCITTPWKDVRISGSSIEFGADNLSSDQITERAKTIQVMIDEMPIDKQTSATANLLRRRIANLSGALVTIVVGGETESDIRERYDRYEDVKRAVGSALVAGILPGMGSVLAKAGLIIKDENPDDSIAEKFSQVLTAQVEFLLGEKYNKNIKYTNLASGETADSPELLGIWDAKLATVTALKAGLATSIILGSNHCVVLGYRTGSVAS